MAIPINIDDLVNQRVVESSRIEFKEGFNPNPIVHTICAFANDMDNLGGGYIVIGIEERDGLPVLPPKGVPQDQIDGILKRLVGLCHHIEPLYNPIAEPVLYGDVYLIVIWVPGGHGRPYKASRDALARVSEKHYYIRRFSSTIVASSDEEKELFYISSDIPFDDRPCLLANVDDLDLGLMREHLQKTGSSLYELSETMDKRAIARDMQLISGPVEDERPLNVGILMFSERSERYFRNAYIQVVSIPDQTGTDMVEKTFRGPIQRQLADALSYIKNFTIEEAIVKLSDQAESRRISNYPYRAVEEILANAVYHRSYQVQEPITVRVTPLGMEIISFPGFARSITDADIAAKNIRGRIYRNRRIGDYLKELHLIEGHNTGFPNAYAALEANGSPDLLFEMDEERSYLSVTIPVHPYFLKKGDAAAQEYETRVLEALANRALSLTELAHAMGYKGISRKLSATVEGMLKRGLLERVAASEGSGTVLRAASKYETIQQEA